MTPVAAPARGALPDLSAATLVTLIVAGSIATVAFDLYGQAISPLLGMPNLAPVPLARQSAGVLFGVDSSAVGHLLHYVAGLIAYPVGWLFIWRPLAERLVPALPERASAALYGVGLWIFALFFMAHLIAGNPPFLGFTGITWVALVGHVLFALVAAEAVSRREGPR